MRAVILFLFITISVFPQDYKTMSREFLLKKTLEFDLEAFIELSVREKDGGTVDLLVSRMEYVVPGKLKNGQAIYTIVSESSIKEIEFSSLEDLDDQNSDEIFEKGKYTKSGNLIIHVLDHNGHFLKPFGGLKQIKNGFVADLNKNGLADKIDLKNFSVKNVATCDVLEITSISEKADSTLRILLNWQIKKDDLLIDWGYDVEDKNNDDKAEIYLGPLKSGKVIPEVIFKWNSNNGIWELDKGRAGDHFRVLDLKKDLNEQLAALRDSGLKFKNSPESVNLRSKVEMLEKGASPQSLGLSSPYKYSSLKGKSLEELKSYMSKGKKYYEYVSENDNNYLPKDFWQGDAKTIALELVEKNRSSDHKDQYLVSIDDIEQLKLPEESRLFYRYESSACYTSSKSNMFVNVSKKNSYLLYSNSVRNGTVFYNFIRSTPAISLKLIPLKYEEARQLSHVIHWLGQVRTKRAYRNRSMSRSMTTADGSAFFQIGEGPVKYGRAWYGTLQNRWSSSLNDEAYMNFITYLFMEVIREKLNIPEVSIDEGSLEALGEVFKMRESGAVLSPHILKDAVKYIEFLGLTRFKGHLERLKASLKPDPNTVDRVKELRKKMDQKPENWLELYDEKKKLENSVVYHTTKLYDLCDAVLHKLSIVNKPEKLFKMAVKTDDDFQWAFYMLQKYPDFYLKALEFWLVHEEGKWAQQVFAEIKRVNPERAREIAVNDKQFLSEDLTAAVVDEIDGAKLKQDPDERRKELLEILTDVKKGFSHRSDAISLLVPAKNPLQDNSPEIDDVLMQLFESENFVEDNSYILGDAASALLSREKKGAFEHIFKFLKEKYTYNYDRIFSDLVKYYNKHPHPEYRREIEAEVRKGFTKTNKKITNYIVLAWALELEDLKEKISHIATSSVLDVEDERGSMSGGNEVFVKDRLFHTARKVSAAWYEKDALTKARLLLLLFKNEMNSDLVFTLAKARVVKELKTLRPNIKDGEWQSLINVTERAEEFLKVAAKN